ncbi:MAG: 50S ribosomal protein L6 [Patescibacteria group bacterium]
MSRIGKQIIEIPAGTTVAVDGANVKVTGPLGNLSRTFRDVVDIIVVDNTVQFTPKTDSHFAHAMWGTVSSIVRSMVEGVNTKFQKVLSVEGVGYRCDMQGNKLVLNVGFSHPVEITVPEGLEVGVEKNTITISGIDKELVGLFANRVRSKKKPEPYKGKGIRYQGEIITRKQGKKSV